jgi:hypothetical protein
VYTINFNPTIEYPDIENQRGRFIVTVDAGSADDQSLVIIPISTAKLLVNFSPGPYMVSLNPPTLTCQDGQSAQFEVVLADADLAIPDSVNVRVFNSVGEINLVPNPIALDTYTGDLTELCKSQLEKINCSTRLDSGFKIRLSSQLMSTSEQVSTDRILPVTIIGQDCLPLPLSTVTPLPNCDGDVLNDGNDLCKCQSGWSQFQGCPPPVWFVGLMLFLALGLIAFIVWLIPSIRVLISPPPQAFVLACIFGAHFPAIKSSYKIGMERRVSRVKIGGDPRMSEIYVKDLLPVEFVVIRMDNNVQVLTYDQKTKRTALRLIVSDIAATIPTSVPGVSLKFSLKKENLHC